MMNETGRNWRFQKGLICYLVMSPDCARGHRMPVYENLPDLTHWKTVQEFNLSQAALLLAGIDPYDFGNEDPLSEVRELNHQRWKLAWGFCAGIITAIRRGVLTPVQCYTERLVEPDNHWAEAYIDYKEIKPTDRTYDISKYKTIITRDSLIAWVNNENVDIARTRKPKPIKNITHLSTDGELIIDVASDAKAHPPKILSIPYRDHKSEGLEFVDEAIKQFWSTFDEEDPSTAPRREDIIVYLQSKGASGNLARAVDLILRPNALRSPGRRKSQ
ncbi:hypothetical protein [Atlantibacter sp.]|uniref:hypothetical protein n=1 Tax=Atlantibacter sp. TaxID=1903473 RepID=UPI0028A919F7|nr:hypothetical protein [Atlantibacter sp.]